MKGIDEQIKILGNNFRGLWKSVVLEDTSDEYLKDGWSVTFIWKGEYVETPYMETATEALDYAIRKETQSGPRDIGN